MVGLCIGGFSFFFPMHTFFTTFFFSMHTHTHTNTDCIPHYSRLLPVVIFKNLFHLVFFFVIMLKHSVVTAKQVLKGETLWDRSSKAAMNVTGNPPWETQGKEHRPVHMAGGSKKVAKSLNGVCARDRNKTKVSSQQQTDLTESSNQGRDGYQCDRPASVSREDSENDTTGECEIEAKPSSRSSCSDESTSSPTTATDLIKKDGLPSDKTTQTTPPATQNSTKSSKAAPTSAVRNETRNRLNRTKSTKDTTTSTKAVETKTEKPTKVVDSSRSTMVRDQTDNHKIQTELSDSTGVTQNLVTSEGMASSQTTPSKGDGGTRIMLTDPARNSTADSHTEAKVWSQYQQQQLEWALRQYPRSAENRWQLISKNVPGKSEVQCMCVTRAASGILHA